MIVEGCISRRIAICMAQAFYKAAVLRVQGSKHIYRPSAVDSLRGAPRLKYSAWFNDK